jgi:hypothetical protein
VVVSATTQLLFQHGMFVYLHLFWRGICAGLHSSAVLANR